MKWSSPLPRVKFSSDRDAAEPGFGFYVCHDLIGHEGTSLHIYLGYRTLSVRITWPEGSAP